MFAELLDDYRRWEPAALDAEFRRLEVEARALEARRLALLSVVDTKQVGRADGHLSTKAYLKGVARTSGSLAAASIRRARTCRDAPAIGEALAAGHIGLAQVDELSRVHANGRVSDLLPHAAAELLEHAEHESHTQFSRTVSQFIMFADLEGAWQNHLDSVEGRSASVDVVGDEVVVTATGGGALLGEQLTAVFRAFLQREADRDLAARRAEHGDRALSFPLPRSRAQRAFDALAAIFTAARKAADAGLEGELPPIVVNVLFDQRSAGAFLERAGLVLPDGNVLDVAELDDTQVAALLDELSRDAHDLLDRRCETESGHAVHPLLLLRALLTEHVRRVVVNGPDTIINYGRSARVFTGSARRAALLLTAHCEHPGCDLGGSARQVDHNIPWAEGGRTDQANSTVLHGAHNRFKHDARWRRTRADDGRAYWVRPDGSLVLAAGERAPGLTDAEEEQATRRRLDALFAARVA